ncbi:hypothetical protein ES702_05542 [subsurface metagenome]
MKKSFKISLVLFLFVLLSIMGVLSLNVLAVDDINYDFEKDIFYDAESPAYSNEFNVINQMRYTGEYNATFDYFEDEVGAIGTEISSVTSLIAETCVIVEEVDSHKRVLYSGSPVAYKYVRSSFPEKSHGIVELWTKWVSGNNEVWLGEGGAPGMVIRIHESFIRIYYGNGAGGNNLFDVSAIGFVHLKFKFNAITDTFCFSINGTEFIIDENYYGDNVLNCVDTLAFYSNSVDSYAYYDSIDFNWTAGYIEGRNRFSLTDSDSSIKEVNRYEWAFTSPNVLVPDESSNVNGWLDYESGENGGSVQVGYEDFDPLIPDREYEITAVSDDDMGISKDDFTETTKRLNITADIDFYIWTCPVGIVNVTIYHGDANIIADLSFVKSGGVIDMYMLSNGSYVNFGGSFLDEAIQFNLYIDYDLNLIILCYLIVGGPGPFKEEFFCESGKSGLDAIKIRAFGEVGGNIVLRVDYVGIYADCVPVSGGAYGFIELPLNSFWNMETHNLFCVDSVGISKMFYSSNNGSREDYDPVDNYIVEIDSFVNYSGVRIHNMYDDFNSSYIENPSLITFLNLWFELESLVIYGVALNDGNNTYPLEFFYSGIDPDESYFYLDDSDILRFIFITNHEYSEYIHANFDIDDVSTDDMSLSFRSQITSGGFGDIQASYTVGTSNFISFSNVHSEINVALPSDTELARLGVYIYDDDEFNDSVCTGYIYDLQLLDYGDLPFDVDTSALLGIMVSLIIMLFPTMVFYKRFGKKAIAPIFLLMLIICVITSLIPVWLFFVVIFAFAGLFLFDQKRGSGD